MKPLGLIATRIADSKIPGKPLLEVNGLPVIIHVAKRALLSNALEDVVVCTDSEEIIRACDCYSIRSKYVYGDFNNGTERISAASSSFKSDYIIGIQGDDPLLSPDHITSLCDQMNKNISKFDIMIPVVNSLYDSPNSTIRVQSSNSDRVMTLSRAIIPYKNDNPCQFIQRHLSFIGFCSKALAQYSQLEPSYYEVIEKIGLLRALENDMRVYSHKVNAGFFESVKNDDLLLLKVAMLEDKYTSLY